MAEKSTAPEKLRVDTMGAVSTSFEKPDDIPETPPLPLTQHIDPPQEQPAEPVQAAAVPAVEGLEDIDLDALDDVDFDALDEVDLDSLGDVDLDALDSIDFDALDELDFGEDIAASAPTIDEEEMSIGETIATQVPQGVLLGFADEASGWFSKLADSYYGVSAQNRKLKAQGFTGDIGPTTSEEVYRGSRDEYRALTDKAMEDHPGVSIASLIAGGIVPTLAGGLLLKGASTGAKATVAGAAAIGAGEGALVGLGESRAELGDGEYLEAAKDVAVGAALGGAVGAGGQALFNKIAAKRLAKVASKKPTENIDNLFRHDIEAEGFKVTEAAAEDIEVMSHYVVDPKYSGGKTRVEAFEKLMANKQGDVALDKDVMKSLAKLKKAEKIGPTRETLEGTGTLDDALDELDPMHTLSKEFKARGNKQAADDIAGFIQVDKDRNEFHHWLDRSGPNASKSTSEHTYLSQIDKMARETTLRNKGDVTPEMYGLFRKFKAEEMAAEKAIMRIQGVDDALVSSMVRSAEDMRYVVSRGDEYTGLSLEQYFDEYVLANSKQKDHIIQRVDGIEELKGASKKAGANFKDIGRALDNPVLYDELSPEARNVADLWRDQMDMNIVDAEGLGMKVNTRKNYVKQQTLAPIELVKAVRDFSSHVRVDIPESMQDMVFNPKAYWEGIKQAKKAKIPIEFPSAAQRANAKELRDLVAGIEKVTSKPVVSLEDIVTGQKMIKDNRAMRGMVSKMKQGFDSGATFARKGRLPDYMREWDVEKLFYSNLGDITKAGYLSKPLKLMEAHIPVLEKLGLKDYANYVRTYVSDMSGVPRGSTGTLQNTFTMFQLRAMSIGSDNSMIRGMATSTANALPMVLDTLVNSAYASMLGINPRLVVRNYTQPFLMSATEMAAGGAQKGRTKFAQTLAAKHSMKAVTKQAKAGKNYFKILKNDLKEAGFAQPDAITRDLDLDEGIKRGWIGATGKQIEKANKIATALYSHSDIQNRWVTMSMTDELVDKLLQGNKHAIDITNNLPRSFRRTIARGNEKEIRHALRKYYINSTQLSYGRVASSELGRGVGSILSMFTKWPSAVISDIAFKREMGRSTIANRKIMEKYIYPLGGLTALGKLYEDELTDRGELLLPSKRRGLESMAPFNAIYGISDVGHGPIIKTVTDTAEMIKNTASGKMSSKQAKKHAMDMLKLYTPYGLAVKAADLGQTVVTGKKPRN